MYLGRKTFDRKTFGKTLDIVPSQVRPIALDFILSTEIWYFFSLYWANVDQMSVGQMIFDLKTWNCSIYASMMEAGNAG
jgi:hypothetical protein